MIGLDRLKRAISDVPTGGMQTGSPKVKIDLSFAHRVVAEMEQLEREKAELVAQVEAKEFERLAAVTQSTNMFDALRLAIAAFDKYEMNVDDYPSIEHVKMREKLYSATFQNAI